MGRIGVGLGLLCRAKRERESMDSSEAEAFALRVSQYPELFERFNQIVDIMENVEGLSQSADEAEERTVAALRQLGSEVLHGWAEQGAQAHESSVGLGPYRRRTKKIPLAEQFQGDLGGGGDFLPQRERKVGESSEGKLWCGVSRPFPPSPTDHDGLRGRRALRPGGGEDTGALRG